MTNDLNDNDRQRIGQAINTLYKTYFRLHSTTDLMVRAAEYATIYEREQQAEVIKKIENELKELRSNAGFKGLDYHTVKFLESLLNTLKT